MTPEPLVCPRCDGGGEAWVRGKNSEGELAWRLAACPDCA